MRSSRRSRSGFVRARSRPGPVPLGRESRREDAHEGRLRQRTERGSGHTRRPDADGDRRGRARRGSHTACSGPSPASIHSSTASRDDRRVRERPGPATGSRVSAGPVGLGRVRKFDACADRCRATDESSGSTLCGLERRRPSRLGTAPSGWRISGRHRPAFQPGNVRGRARADGQRWSPTDWDRFWRRRGLGRERPDDTVTRIDPSSRRHDDDPRRSARRRRRRIRGSLGRE